MNAKQRRQIRRSALRWMPKMWQAFNVAASCVERDKAVDAIAQLQLCAAALEDAYCALAKRPMPLIVRA